MLENVSYCKQVLIFTNCYRFLQFIIFYYKFLYNSINFQAAQRPILNPTGQVTEDGKLANYSDDHGLYVLQ